MRRGCRLPAAAWACALSAGLIVARPAVADRGDLDVGARLQWAGQTRFGLAAVSHLGLADLWAAYLEVGGDVAVQQPATWRWHTLAGATWLLDVLAWVPAATLAAGVEVGQDGRAAVAALARGEVRYFVSRRLFVQTSVGARWGTGGLAPEVGVGLAWQI